MYDQLVLAIGSPRFSRQLFETAREVLAIRHLVIYKYDDTGGLETLAAESANDDQNMQEAVRQYRNNYYKRDPLIHGIGKSQLGEPQLHTVNSVAIPDAEYRDKLYRNQRMASKTAILIKRPLDTLIVAFLRGEEAGALSDEQQIHINRSYPTIAAAVRRHFELALLGDMLEPEKCVEEMRRAFPVLSSQEATVCSMAMRGYSGEAMSLVMGISIHSVVTYRRRAYSKLGITSQNELFSILLRRVLDSASHGAFESSATPMQWAFGNADRRPLN